MNNAAREIKHPILGAAESLPLLNEEFAKSLFCGGKDSSAPTSSLLLPTLSVFFASRAKFRDADEAENRRLVTRGRRRTKRSFESGDDHAAPIARQGDSAYPAFPRIPCRNQTFGHWCYINITLHPAENHVALGTGSHNSHQRNHATPARKPQAIDKPIIASGTVHRNSVCHQAERRISPFCA